jgi:EAL domain-containing protein (putative c-di-GMP-specific phosphodiesterase class I)
VVAEGIEKKGQLEQLLSCGCDFGQGFYFSKPVADENIMKMLKDGKV